VKCFPLLVIVPACLGAAVLGADSPRTELNRLLWSGEFGSSVDLQLHTVVINSDGVSREGKQFESQLDDLFKSLASQSSRRRIIVFVHGGLETLTKAKSRAIQLVPEIMAADPTSYPIFINWEAGFGTSYFRHVVYERDGISYRGAPTAPLVALGSPAVAVADIGRGIFRLPINTINAFAKMAQNEDAFYGKHPRLFPVKNRYEEILQSFSPTGSTDKNFRGGLEYSPKENCKPSIQLSLGTDFTKKFRPSRLVGTLSTIPFQFTTEPVIDILGTPAWHNMLRRAHSMFYPPANFIIGKGVRREPVLGAGYLFFNRLNRFLDEHPDFQLDLIGHSMGTIILNDVYREFPDLRTRNLVYMGAACSVRDFQATAGEHIIRSKTKFFNLCLHPRAEIEEVHALGLPVRGSLLIWIDEFFQSPESFGDRTLGSFENAVIAYRLLPRTDRVHLKAFAVGRNKTPAGLGDPHKHSEFEDFVFWEPDFWSTTVCSDKMYVRNHCVYGRSWTR
jgi:pimeloyl-ACP methyl ester carboxylesterase